MSVFERGDMSDSQLAPEVYWCEILIRLLYLVRSINGGIYISERVID